MAGRHYPDLAEGLTPEERAELGDLTEVQERLASYVAPSPGAEETRLLLDRLRPLLPPARTAAAGGLRHWVELAWGQALLLEPAFWWAGGVVFAVGLLLTALDRGGPAALLLALAAPVLVAGAVAYAFRPAARSLWEVEKAAPIHPLALLYTRLGVVLAANLAVVLTLVCLVWAANSRLILWRLAMAWLGPMLALTGGALYATVRWGALVGTAVPMVPWCGLVLALWRTAEPGAGASLGAVVADRVLPLVQSDGVLLGAGAALCLGVLLIRQAGLRWLGETAP